MPIGVICAIPQELTHLLDQLDTERRVQIAGTEFACGLIDDVPVVLVGAGMGKVNAALVTSLLVDRFGCSAVLFSGVAGGLDPGLAIGDIVIADRVVQIDAGTIAGERLSVYQAGHVESINPTAELGYSVDPVLMERVRMTFSGFALPGAARLVYGLVLTGDQYLHCEVTRERLYREHGGRAIEMEGGAVAQVCERFSVPWLIVRALSDLAGSDALQDFAAFAEQVAGSSAAVVRRLLPQLHR